MWLSSRGVAANPDNANFGPGAVNTEGGMSNANSYSNTFNSNGNENDNGLGVRPTASINCGYVSIACMRDNIETNHSPFVISDKLKIDKYGC